MRFALIDPSNRIDLHRVPIQLEACPEVTELVEATDELVGNRSVNHISMILKIIEIG